VSILGGDTEARWTDGQQFPLQTLGTCRTPTPGWNIAPSVWASVLQAQASARVDPVPSEEVMALVGERQEARARQDWPAADRLRQRILSLGWQVKDTPQGPQLTPV